MEVIIGAICLIGAFLILIACEYETRKLAREYRKWCERKKRRANRAKSNNDIFAHLNIHHFE